MNNEHSPEAQNDRPFFYTAAFLVGFIFTKKFFDDIHAAASHAEMVFDGVAAGASNVFGGYLKYRDSSILDAEK